MSYSDDLCRLAICNLDIIEEANKVAEHVQKEVFDAIYRRIEHRVNKEKGWKRLDIDDIDTDDPWNTDAVELVPEGWPEEEDGDQTTPSAKFYSYYKELNEMTCWLSYATGLYGNMLAFAFMTARAPIDKQTGKKKQLRPYFKDFFAKNNQVLGAAGFKCDDKSGTIYLPFVLNASELAEEYPNFDNSLNPLDTALDKLFKARSTFDNFFDSLSK